MNDPSGMTGRIATLDLLRGIAVLGILAVNIAGFAGPRVATDTPNLPHAVGTLDEAAFGFVFLVFEGKMRALFSLLFGASMLLFIAKAEARGRDGNLLQLRRLGWLLLIGWLHSMLLWWGDILFVYAVAGTFALALRRQPNRRLLGIAAGVYLGWHGFGTIGGWYTMAAEEAVRNGVASAADQAWMAREQLAAYHPTLVRIREAHLPARWGWQIKAQFSEKRKKIPSWMRDRLSAAGKA